MNSLGERMLKSACGNDSWIGSEARRIERVGRDSSMLVVVGDEVRFSASQSQPSNDTAANEKLGLGEHALSAAGAAGAAFLFAVIVNPLDVAKALRLRSNELKLERQLENLEAEISSCKKKMSSMEKERHDFQSIIEALQEEKKLLQSKLRKASASGKSIDISNPSNKKDMATSTEDLGLFCSVGERYSVSSDFKELRITIGETLISLELFKSVVVLGGG